MATPTHDTTPYWSTSTTFPQFAKLAGDADADVVGGGDREPDSRLALRDQRSVRNVTE